MRTRSLRLRVIVGVLTLLAVVLVAVGVLVERTLSAQLRGDLQQRLVDRVGYARLLASDGYSSDAILEALSTNDGIRVEFRNASGDVVVATPTPGGPGPGGPPAGRPPHAPPSVASAVDISSDSGGITASLDLSGGTITATGSTFDITQTLSRLRSIEIVAGAATLVVVALLLTGVVGVALRPLSRMTVLARGIAHGGRGDRLRPENPRTELGRTAEAFDEMIDALETAEREAHAAADAATAAEERMRRLLADVSHELRTPIAALQARAETLLRQNPPRERREDLALGMVRDTRRAARLVDDLLLMNRLEQAPADQVRPRPVDLGAVVATVVEEQRVLGPELRITTESLDGTWVSADPERLAQIVANLLGNARRAVADGGEVTVRVGRSDGTAVVEVADTGPGVPPADRERVFDRFVRLDTGRSRAEGGAGLGGSGLGGSGLGGSGLGGSGLGLPISRALARAHGGDVVCADSQRGARFVLTLPLLTPASGAEQPALV